MAEKKTPLVERIDTICRQINLVTGPYPEDWCFGRKRSIKMSEGVRLVANEGDGNILTLSSPKELAHQIVLWLQKNGLPDHFMTLKNAREAVDYWLSVTPFIEPSEIKNVRWKDDPGYTWHRLPWSLSETNDNYMPTWDALLSRMSNKEAFMAWVGSLLDEDSSLQQYVWMHGMGGDGKGSISRYLAEVFGLAYAAKQPPARGDRFWTYGIVGKRLVVFNDCDDHKFITSGFFKSLTGGDPIAVEIKGGDAFTARLHAKYLVISNEMPSLSSELADTRRIIYCEFQKREDNSFCPNFERKLWDEGGRFLSKCYHLYKDNYPKHGPIKAETGAIDDHIDLVEMSYQEFFDFHFFIDERAVKDEWVNANIMQRLIERKFKSYNERMNFYSWLKRKFELKSKVFKNDDNKATRGWPNLRLVAECDKIPIESDH